MLLISSSRLRPLASTWQRNCDRQLAPLRFELRVLGGKLAVGALQLARALSNPLFEFVARARDGGRHRVEAP